MQNVDLRKDAIVFRSELAKRIASLSSEDNLANPISAIEVGYECEQIGWIFIHADRRPEHSRDGEWTIAIEDGELIGMPHWEELIQTGFQGSDVSVTRIDGTSFTISAYDEGSESKNEEEEGSFAEAIGQMILDVLMTAKSEKLFASLGTPGTIQLDIEDFNGYWGWPEYDDLGKTNMA